MMQEIELTDAERIEFYTEKLSHRELAEIHLNLIKVMEGMTEKIKHEKILHDDFEKYIFKKYPDYLVPVLAGLFIASLIVSFILILTK